MEFENATTQKNLKNSFNLFPPPLPRFSLLDGSSAWAAMNEEYLFLERECSFLEAGMFAANLFFSKCIC